MGFTDFLRNFHEKHEKLKHTIHNKWRYPLPKSGQYAMALFYFCIPIVGGHYVMEWAKSKSVDEIGARGEKLREKKLQGFGNKTVIDGKVESIGAGGIGGGVHLALSDEETQKKNKAMLEAMFRRERKRRRKEKKDSEQDKEQKESNVVEEQTS
mmetsp:Transcript_8807/g.13211  ORF Transcript_8807/g.13211 Transcript_8807/m.13211 type:complete len:154 (+) Transcript_8807:191-652(+)